MRRRTACSSGLQEYEDELKKVSETIRIYNEQIAENERKIEAYQKELDEKQEKLGSDRPHTTVSLRGWNRSKTLQNAMTGTGTVSAGSWRTGIKKKA